MTHRYATAAGEDSSQGPYLALPYAHHPLPHRACVCVRVCFCVCACVYERECERSGAMYINIPGYSSRTNLVDYITRRRLRIQLFRRLQQRRGRRRCAGGCSSTTSSAAQRQRSSAAISRFLWQKNPGKIGLFCKKSPGKIGLLCKQGPGPPQQ